MPLPATYHRVTLHFLVTATGAKASFALYYLKAAGGADPTLSTIATYANDAKTAYSAAVSGLLSDSAVVEKVTWKYVSAGNEVEGDNNNGTIAGTVSGDMLPEEVVVCIQRRTGLVGRRNRGRIFFPYLSEAANVNGEIEPITARPKVAAVATMVKNQITANSVVFDPYTPNFKDGLLVKVVQSGYNTSLCSRRDRRFPRQLSVVRV